MFVTQIKTISNYERGNWLQIIYVPSQWYIMVIDPLGVILWIVLLTK